MGPCTSALYYTSSRGGHTKIGCDAMTTTAFWTMLLVTSLGRTKSSEDDSCRLHEIPNNVVFAGTSVSTSRSSGW